MNIYFFSGSIIERSEQRFPPSHKGTNREYHAVTRGWIVNELVRRVDPHKRTVGEILRDDVAGPLEAGCVMGGRVDEAGRLEGRRVKDVSAWSVPFVLMQSFMPAFIGRNIELGATDIAGFVWRVNLFLMHASLMLKMAKESFHDEGTLIG